MSVVLGGLDMPRGGAALLAVAALTLVSCSSGTPSGRPTPRPSNLGSSQPAPSPMGPTLAPPTLSDFPPVDTPIGSLDLSPTLRGLWQTYDVSLVPGRSVAEEALPTPRVRNATGGAVSDAEAQVWAEAEMRTNVYLGWMDANLQLSFSHHLRSDVFLAGPIGQALRRGDKVPAPKCDLFAEVVAVVPVDSGIRQLFAGRGEATSAGYALVMRFGGPCTVTTAGGQLLVSIPADGGVTVEGGMLRRDVVLGDIWYSDAGATCPSSGGPSVCQAAS